MDSLIKRFFYESTYKEISPDCYRVFIHKDKTQFLVVNGEQLDRVCARRWYFRRIKNRDVLYSRDPDTNRVVYAARCIFPRMLNTVKLHFKSGERNDFRPENVYFTTRAGRFETLELALASVK